MEKIKVAIIGGGASGLVSAISFAKTLKYKNNVEIAILERLDRVGKKILATGNGKCNLSNLNADEECYHSQNPKFVKDILSQFDSKDTIKFFESIGLICRVEEDGRLYPYSNQASSVLDVLRMEVEHLGIKEMCNFEVNSIKRYKNKFVISSINNQKYEFSKIILSTGGNAQPNLGSNGSGHRLLKSFGHTITDIYPSLVQLKSDSKIVKGLNGIKINAEAKVICDKKIIRKEKGELLFTEYGLSGILILQLSTVIKNLTNKNIKISIDLMPEFEKSKVKEIIQNKVLKEDWKNLENFFVGILNKKIGQMVLKSSGIYPLSRKVDSLSNNEIIKIIETIKDWQFNITGTMSWNNAQVTSGGADTEEFDSNSLESKKVKNLYATGELLDVDGDCGGFNLQWAWSTGFIAGKSAATELNEILK